MRAPQSSKWSRPLRAALGASVLAAAVPSVVAPAHAQPPAKQATAAIPGATSFQLKNGLRVVHVARPGLPMVTVQLWVGFGSSQEPAGQHGAARMLELLMFEGSEHLRPGEHRRRIEAVGGETTSLTTEDVTAFHNTVPSQYLDLALELEAERMQHLWIRPETVSALGERLAEEATRQQASPLFRSYQRALTMAFGGGGYGWTPSGSPADLKSLTAEQLQALYTAHYTPSAARLVIVGGTDLAATKAAVEKWFGPIPAGAPPAAAGPVGEGGSKHASELAGSQVPLVLAAYPFGTRTDESGLSKETEEAAMQVAGAILWHGPSSRLHKKLVAAKLATEVGGQTLIRDHAGLMVIHARLVDGSAPMNASKVLLGEVERLSKSGPTAAEFKRAKGQVLTASTFGMESATTLANQIGVALGAENFAAEREALSTLTAADVKKAAAAYLSASESFVVTSEPTGSRVGGNK